MTRRLLTLATFVSLLLCAAILAGCSAPNTNPVAPPSKQAVPAITPQGTAVTSGTPAPSQRANTDTQGHTIIYITDSEFQPANTTVKKGATVIWENAGKSTHSIVFDDGSVKSPDIKPTSVAGHKFLTLGTFSYHDSHNPLLTGTIIVK